mgnify:CR=1 FL=1
MAKFNPKLPDDSVNISQGSPLRDLILLVTGSIGVLLLLVFGIGFTLDLLIPHVPISVEQKLLSPLVGMFQADEQPSEDGSLTETEMRRKLQQETLEEILKSLIEQWPGATYDFKIGISNFGGGDQAPPNAAAFPGGYILVTRSLLDGASSENEIAMVIGHELGHFRSRDHLRGLGKGLALSLILAAIGSSGTSDSVTAIAEFAGGLALRSFSREQEKMADEFGLSLVAKHYGHVTGATVFFERVSEQDKDSLGMKQYFRTHPLSENRIDAIRTLAQRRNWRVNRDLQPLPWSKKEEPAIEFEDPEPSEPALE